MKIMQRTAYDQGTHFVSSNGTDPQNMFNNTVSETTTNSGSLEVVITPGQIGAIGFANVSADSVDVVATVDSGATQVFSESIDLNQTEVNNWFDYFYEPFDTITDFLIEGIPPYGEAEFTITFNGSNTACGICAWGLLRQFGSVSEGAQLGILDYSTKETDGATGVVTFAEGPFSRRMDVEVFAETSDLNKMQKVLTSVISTPTFYSGAYDTSFESSFVVFGFYRDFSIVVPYPNHFLCNLEIEGLI